MPPTTTRLKPTSPSPKSPDLGARPTADEPARSDAMERAAQLLAQRPHAIAELRTKLLARGLEGGAVDRAIERLEDLRLLDDRAFATQWVEERSARKGLAPAALLSELRGKGVPREIAEEAVAELEVDEITQAKELAARLLRKVVSKPLEVQARRLQAMLLRRGFSTEAAIEGVRAILPPEGWD